VASCPGIGRLNIYIWYIFKYIDVGEASYLAIGGLNFMLGVF
jgi:hypothetical protein